MQGFGKTGLVLALALAGCAGDGPDGAAPGGEYAAIQAQVFNTSCVTGACHSSGTRAGDLSLEEGESYAELVGVLASNPAAAARGLLRVTPSEVGSSFLIAKLNGMLDAGEGSLMPLGAPPLSPDELAMIEIWIENGAGPDAASEG
ncbi:MAG: hypothetical protein VCC00_14100 [Deltaproteobacteria bacterium]